MNIKRQIPASKHFSRAAEEVTGRQQHTFNFLFHLNLSNMEEANKLIGLGKKHLVMGKAVEAVNTLQDACSLLAKKYGDTADECGEAFYWCGKALLDLARMENSVLGNALQGVPEEEDEEKPKDSNVEMESVDNLDEKTRDELRVQVYDAMAEKKEDSAEKDAGDEREDESATEKMDDAKVQNDNTSEMNKDGSTEKQVSEKEDPSKETKGEGKPSVEQPGEGEEDKESVAAEMEATKTETEEPEDEDEEMEGEEEAEESDGDEKEKAEGEDTAEKGSDDDDEVGNLQLAWEMLEVAKVIYKRKENKEDQLMAAQAHLKLGEVSAESGNYTQAIEDFQECLKLQLKHLEPNSRLLAETHYQLGLTYSLNCQYKQAIDELDRSISVIKSRLEKLQELIDKAEGPDALPEERQELEELKALLPEIQEKVEDATEGLKTGSTDAEVVKDVLVDLPSEKAASDISHLVRKKRKPEESPVKEVKKVKQDEAESSEVKGPKKNETHTNGQTK
uniref:Nuclear autoantigenic sperm protein n=1 Tax=Neogobius melanostomus TaxID=47308 RepID=A0A8C6U7I2_9GOBI